MSNLEKIQSAESQLGQVQDALAMVQQGLEHAESVAVVAEQTKARTGQVVKIGLVLGFVALVLVLVAKKRSARQAEADAGMASPGST